MNILITGNAGFIGLYLSAKLIADGHVVRGIDLNPLNSGVQMEKHFLGDIRNRGIIEKAMESIDLVIHLAAKHHDFGIEEKDYLDVNVHGTRNLLVCCANKGVKKFIFYSTVAVYGNQLVPSHEDMISRPKSSYGRSKLAAEQAICEWVREDPDRSAIIFRPTVVFGPNNFANMYNLINQVCRRRFFPVGDGSNIKSVAYVENLVEATSLCSIV